MALATTICTALNSGPSAASTITGAQQFVVTGTFTSTDGKNALLVMETSADDGVTYAPVPGSASPYPTTFVLDLATGSRVRANVLGGGPGVAITVMAGALP